MASVKKLTIERAKVILQILQETNHQDPTIEMMALVSASGTIFGELLAQKNKEYTESVSGGMKESISFLFDDAVMIASGGESVDDDDDEGESLPH